MVQRPKRKISAVAERLEHISGIASEVDCGTGWLVELGDRADRLIAAAATENASMIVVGSTGRARLCSAASGLRFRGGSRAGSSSCRRGLT
jgi:nucleotide-binding universal stress UspA family protein